LSKSWNILRNHVAVRNEDFDFWPGFGEGASPQRPLSRNTSRNNVRSQKDSSYMATVFIKLL
jgi:hypothetical protein